MLGKDNHPDLLVTVKQEHRQGHFEFRVINGAWDGTYTDGYITIWDSPSGSWSSLDKMEILTDNQDRLRSSDWYGEYNEVFANYNNPDYVSPYREKYVQPVAWDDDIPF
jgi:hypothetical protein